MDAVVKSWLYNTVSADLADAIDLGGEAECGARGGAGVAKKPQQHHWRQRDTQLLH
jgi:hypothetical protein